MKPTGQLALAGLLTVCACTVSSPERIEVRLRDAIPENFVAGTSATGTSAVDWWTSFGDPRLDEIVAEALAHNHDLRAAVARIDTAVVQARLAGADLVPSVSLSASGQRQRQNFIGLPIPGGTLSRTFNSFGVSLGLSWELDLWGRIRAGKRAAIADVEASREDARASWLSIAGQTSKAWFATLAARAQVELASRTVKSYASSLAVARRRFEAGTRPAVDLRLAENTLASGRANLATRREQLASAHRQLEVLLGRYPAGSLPANAELPAVPPPIPAGQPLDLLRRRPDVRAAERRLAALTTRIEEARAALWPRITLTSNVGTASREFQDLLNRDFFAWNLLGGIVAPLVDGARLRNNVALARARAREATEAYASVSLRAFREVETGLATEALLRRQEEQLAQAEAAATNAEQLAKQRYERGVGSYLDVLESQRRSLAAASQRLTARRRRLEHRIDLHLALGGGFAASQSDQPAGHRP